MSDHLDRLAARAVGVLPVLTPLPRPLFAPDADPAPVGTDAEVEARPAPTLASHLPDAPPPPARRRDEAQAVTPAAARREAPEPLRATPAAPVSRVPTEAVRVEQPRPAVDAAAAEGRSVPPPPVVAVSPPLLGAAERVVVAAEAAPPRPAPSERPGEPAPRPSPPVRRGAPQGRASRPPVQARTTPSPTRPPDAAPAATALADVTAPHVVAVTIGRIDVAALTPPPRPVRAVAPAAGVGPALEGYLADVDAR